MALDRKSDRTLAALRRYWGYDSFLPLQERIIGSLLAGRDACVIMPTGGGKSLCYQLPAALAARKTVLVISPLIALMQDQVAQLTLMGIPSAALNSSMQGPQQAELVREAQEGKYRLLYLSPERLARQDTIAWLQRVPVSLLAIDEAHCISEWGHEFRPEYRQLSRLREQFPGLPIAAFTASATQRVRHDIIAQLQLREPHRYIASFHRPNLRYVVRECDAHTQRNLLTRALRQYAGSSVIVYAPTIKGVEETLAFLEAQGVPAIAYHGQMDAATRRQNQERWMSDEVKVLVGTIAFGLGINKPAVRAVIHLSLPKSIEQYYQEAGRAGRDGLAADCVLLWQKRDAGLLAYFAEQINDPDEKERAWQRYREIRGFVESRLCRHLQVCLHFGEQPKWSRCDACDVCGYEPPWFRAAAAAQAEQRPDAAPKTPRKRPPAPVDAPSEADPDLREYLCEWRRETARKQGVPAYIVMHDASLEDLCLRRPRSLAQLREVHGFGERKTLTYGPQILQALKDFASGARATPPPEKKKRVRAATGRERSE